jgi:hypothetical protein
MKNQKSAVQIRTNKIKTKLIEQLSKTPIVEIACQRAGIGRNSYYRWRRSSKKFADQCDRAIAEGCAFINDLAESQLLNAMKDKNLTAVMYWLNHRHNAYKNKLEVAMKNDNAGKLTPEETRKIKRSLTLAKLIESNNPKETK